MLEVTSYRDPCAAGRDSQSLVVVPVRTSRGERVSEPEGVPVAEGVSQVTERGRSLVGCDDEVWIGAVHDPYARRMYDLALDDVVGQLEQATDECLVRSSAIA